jgi:hypothetical protein
MRCPRPRWLVVPGIRHLHEAQVTSSGGMGQEVGRNRAFLPPFYHVDLPLQVDSVPLIEFGQGVVWVLTDRGSSLAGVCGRVDRTPEAGPARVYHPSQHQPRGRQGLAILLIYASKSPQNPDVLRIRNPNVNVLSIISVQACILSSLPASSIPTQLTTHLPPLVWPYGLIHFMEAG